ncbi:hypothetical protein B0I35DRAFT_517503 [Stachybotrys elegans]|uniref:Uncharacterized protein n=1 Tax=Stachybotrys elegans TaxID=80388 RepID=A0A8K0SD73_9HYPO|nr:hypothetical protein B0I35DRAFT_517503 [Stachybotrys elegans]
MEKLNEYLTGRLADLVTKYDIIDAGSEVHLVVLTPIQRHWLVSHIRCHEHFFDHLDGNVLLASLVHTPCCPKAKAGDVRKQIFKPGKWVGNEPRVAPSKSTGYCGAKSVEELRRLASLLDPNSPDLHSIQESSRRTEGDVDGNDTHGDDPGDVDFEADEGADNDAENEAENDDAEDEAENDDAEDEAENDDAEDEAENDDAEDEAENDDAEDEVDSNDAHGDDPGDVDFETDEGADNDAENDAENDDAENDDADSDAEEDAEEDQLSLVSGKIVEGLQTALGIALRFHEQGSPIPFEVLKAKETQSTDYFSPHILTSDNKYNRTGLG